MIWFDSPKITSVLPSMHIFLLLWLVWITRAILNDNVILCDFDLQVTEKQRSSVKPLRLKAYWGDGSGASVQLKDLTFLQVLCVMWILIWYCNVTKSLCLRPIAALCTTDASIFSYTYTCMPKKNKIQFADAS